MLNAIAAETAQAVDALAAGAIVAYVEAYNLQVDDIRSALGEMERGDFASESDVARVFAKWAS
jgi:predicted transcriptional regulator